MKIFITILSMIAGALLLPQVTIASELKSNKSTQAMKMPMYQPPRRGAPNIRVGGGTRGLAGVTPTLHVLAPDHVGLTASEQPTLNWHMSKPGSMRLEIMLIDEEGMDPLLELSIDSSKLKAGVQSVNLADHGVKLKPGMKYQWSVVLVAEEGHRSNDIISSGMIEHRNITGSLKTKLSKADSQEDVFIYAQEGYWYDAISELTGLIKKHPDNELFKKQHKQLLEQVGLLKMQ